MAVTVTEERRPLYSSPLGLFPFQVDGVARTYWQWSESPDSPVMLALWDTGTGKALRNDQRVATPSGWRTIGSLQPGDSVLGSDGAEHAVVAVCPQGVRPLYRVTTSDGQEIVADGDHLWAVNTRLRWHRGLPLKVKTTEEILAEGLRDQDGFRHFLPLTQPLDLPFADLPVDPYLLGALLGDGTFAESTVKLTSADDLISLASLPEGITARPLFNGSRGSVETWSFITPRGQRNPLRDRIETLGLMGRRSWEKHIPEEYLWGSLDQRLALLRGLLDTDGSIDQRQGAIEFSSTSRRLAEGVQHLVQSFGGLAKISQRRTTYSHRGEVRTGRTSYRVGIYWSHTECPFLLPRKADLWRPRTRRVCRAIRNIERVEDAEATCIVVTAPDSLFLTEGMTLTHNSHLAMASLAFAFEDDLIDQAIVVAEANKVLDWVEDDFPTFTDLTVAQHKGDPKKREKLLATPPQVLVMSYETGRNDICEFKGPKSIAVVGDKMLSEALRGQRTAIVFDEFSRLRNRSSKTYVAWDYLINRVLRRSGTQPRLLGLTATSVEKHPADHWNAGRLLAPQLAGSVADFEANYVATRSVFDNSPASWKNLTPAESFEPEVIPLNQMFASITSRKRKTDPDVIDFFPAKMENPPTMVDLDPLHRKLYDSVEEIFADEDLDEEVARQGFGLLRLIAGHPMSLTHSQGVYAREVLANAGLGFIEGLKVAKVEAMLEWQRLMEDQQTVIFTFYGRSILPYLEHALKVEGYTVSVNHGGMSDIDRKRSQDAYKAGDTQIFLSSDAGAKGLNLGVGSGLLHYETPMLYSTFDQRSNRIHRIDSKHASVTIDHLVVRDTVEEGITGKMLQRAQWAEAVQDPDLTEDSEPTERFLRAKDRIEMFRRAR